MSSSVKQATTLDLDKPAAQCETFAMQFSGTRNAPPQHNMKRLLSQRQKGPDIGAFLALGQATACNASQDGNS